MADDDMTRLSPESLMIMRARVETAARADAPEREVHADFWAAARVVMPHQGEAPVHLRADKGR